MRRLMEVLNNTKPVFHRLNLSTSIGEFGSFEIPAKETKSVEADIMNYGSSGIYFSAYNQNGFLLNNGVRIIGPCAAFPRNAFCWNVKDINDVNEDSLSLFFILEPRLDVLVIGKGETNVQVNSALIFDVCRKHKLSVEVLPTLSVEVLPTQVSVGTFNFLNSEGRYVAAALIPPRRMDVYDHADREAGRLLFAEEAESTSALLPESNDKPKLLESGPAERLVVQRSPLLGPSKSDQSD
ncbi:NADH dehydrogenase [ubiquinone] 1 alpha subcomplex assembly factor 3 [Paragonimus heterotremus]|uniref:NADH dehydrogenase [ubiquinone] 1 alpha subcomplex assembly factor 3 n=1 Tax=Paragonimus heterotremus TaxID=100268 RepID=A0A8J4T1A2_9TREM|nr:NADH dehydrogenase [ubiquinone] 1 alpha subcomplex assembly factor 3 [Paragonimus heterotremus]